MPTPTTPPPRRTGGYPGRPDLDRANMRFRRAAAALYREAQRSPDIEAEFPAILAAAVETLNTLAERAEQAADNSQRNQDLLAREERKLNRALDRARRRGVVIVSPAERAAR